VPEKSATLSMPHEQAVARSQKDHIRVCQFSPTSDVEQLDVLCQSILSASTIDGAGIIYIPFELRFISFLSR
jgi:hypothetical protein